LLIIDILLIIIMCLYLLLREQIGMTFLFWPIIWSILFVTFILVTKTKYKISSLILLELALTLVLIFSLPHHFQMGRDVYFESQYASTIVEQGTWNPEAGSGFAKDYYGYNPALHIILAFASITTGFSTYLISKYVLLILLRIILVLSVFLVIRKLVKSDLITYLSTFVFIISTGMSFIDISRRLIASIFVVLSIYALLKSYNQKWNILFYLFSFLVIISNHSLSYLLLGILGFLWIIKLLFKQKEIPKIGIKLFYFFVVFHIWEIFISNVVLSNDYSYIIGIFNLIFGGEALTSLFSGSRSTATIYNSIEILVIYLYHFLFLLISIGGFGYFTYKYSKNQDDQIQQKQFLITIGIFSLCFYCCC